MENKLNSYNVLKGGARKMENYNNKISNKVTADQEILLKKLLKSRKITDKEYREYKNIIENRMFNSYDASILIAHLITLLKFRRHYYSKKHKAYKRCVYCGSRDNVSRYLDVKEDKKLWICDFCQINLDSSRFVPTKVSEESEETPDWDFEYERLRDDEIIAQIEEYEQRK